MMQWYRWIAFSSHPVAQVLRSARDLYYSFSIPVPRLLGRVLLALFVGARSIVHFFLRVFVCEPLFKAYCTRHGKRFHTGVYTPWVTGAGVFNVGDDVKIVGRCSIKFGARYSERPTLEIGNRTSLGHNVAITIGKRVTIGDDCLIAAGVSIFDSPGHPIRTEDRLAGAPAPMEAVRAISIGNNAWIGREAIIGPGVNIGDGAVVSAGSVVLNDVAPNTMVAGNPARRISYLDLSRIPPAKSPGSTQPTGPEGSPATIGGSAA